MHTYRHSRPHEKSVLTAEAQAHEGRFADRRDAGRRLARRLAQYARREDVLVLALPRGGVPVAYEVATLLRAPLDVFVVRKLGVPGHEEFAMGALGLGGVRVLNQDTVEALGITTAQIELIAEREGRELARRAAAYRGERPSPAVEGRTVILVDDGLATGATMRAAVAAICARGPREVVVAVPVAAPEALDALRMMADEVVCLLAPPAFVAVGAWYRDFSETSDEEVRSLLAQASRWTGAADED